jgi:hypothetical protein
MGIKGNLHPLMTSDVVTEDQATVLRKYSITSLEELFGALLSRRAGVASALGIPESDVDDLKTKVSEALPREVVESYHQPIGTMKRGFGARIDPPPNH